ITCTSRSMSSASVGPPNYERPEPAHVERGRRQSGPCLDQRAIDREVLIGRQAVEAHLKRAPGRRRTISADKTYDVSYFVTDEGSPTAAGVLALAAPGRRAEPL